MLVFDLTEHWTHWGPNDGEKRVYLCGNTFYMFQINYFSWNSSEEKEEKCQWIRHGHLVRFDSVYFDFEATIKSSLS